MDNHRELAYALLRITAGVMFFFYGVGKFIGGVDNFAGGLAERLSGSPLPSEMVTAFGYVLPFLEVITGGLLIVGLFSGITLVVAALLLMALTFGAVMEPKPPTVADNMLYALVVFILLWLLPYNRYSLDRLYPEE